MFKRTGTDLDTHPTLTPTLTPTPTQQKLTCALQTARLLPNGSAALIIPFSANWRCINQVFHQPQVMFG
jgi:hypothetical protein